MDAGKRTINEIFNGSRILEIPFFQRAYVWGEPQWIRLLEDVESVSQTRKPYFMGPVILKQQRTETSDTVGDVRTVIDGQQRLTTLSVMLKVLCLKTDTLSRFDRRFRLDDGRTAIQHNHNDIEAYSRIMELESIAEITNEDKISEAYKFFANNINPERVDFDTVCHSLMFVGIDLSADEDEQQIFDTINSLGVRLTTAELLKNFFFGRDDIEDYKAYWFNVFEKDDETKEYWDNEITTGRLKRTFIDLFFYSFLQIKIQDKSLDVRTEDKIDFSRVERLFDSYKRFINIYYEGDKRTILTEIKEYAVLFRTAFDIDIINDEISEAAGIERINAIIFALETATLIPYVLFIERNINDNTIKNELYGAIETYVVRRLITRASNKNYNQLFTERLIINRILTKQDFIDFIIGQNDTTNRMPSDSDIITAINEYILTNKNAAGILYLLESKIRDRRRHSTQLLGINKYSLEHIMPKKWRNNWYFTGDQAAEDLRDRKLLTLGNLTIITQALNASIRDADWETKKSGRNNHYGLQRYAEGIETISSYLDKTVWDESVIQERADYLSSMALESWSFILTDEQRLVIQQTADNDEETSMLINGDSEGFRQNSETAAANFHSDCIPKINSYFNISLRKKERNLYETEDEQTGVIIHVSNPQTQGNRERYWFGYQKPSTEKLSAYQNKYIAFGCGSVNNIFIISLDDIENIKNRLYCTVGSSRTHWHVNIYRDNNDKWTWRLIEPTEEIDIVDKMI